MSKYGNRKVNVDGFVFDSRKEAARWNELKLLERVGLISNLHRQVKFGLLPAQRVNGKVVERACTYTADFTYFKQDGSFVVEDTKGFRTDAYKLKKK